MAMEIDNVMCGGLQGPGPGGGRTGVPSLDDLAWSSSLFDELNSLVDVDDDLFQDGECNTFPDNFDNLDFTTDLLSWNTQPSNEQLFTGDWNKSDSLSYASSNCSVQSPLSVDSPTSSSQFVPEEPDISSSVQMSPVSLYSEASRSPSLPEQPEEKYVITTPTKNNAPVKQRKLPLVVPKTAIQPKAILIPSAANIQPASRTTPKTIIFQPLTTLLSKQQPLIAIQPSGQQVVLAPSAVVQLPTSGMVAAQPLLAVNGGAAPLTTPSVNILPHIGLNSDKTTPVKPFVHSSAQTPDCETDVNVIRRQQRMIKNRESAFQSRRKKKEYMQGLELRLRAALFENDRLKKENGSLQKLLEEVVSENQKLKVTAPKRRAVCLMMVAVFVILNFNPLSVLESTSGEFDIEVRTVTNRHLLEFSPGEVNVKDQDSPQNEFRPGHFISTEKALMIVKEEPLLYIPAPPPPPPPPCQPHINQTETLRLSQELRGWVHRHEAERTKTRRTISTHKAQAMQKQDVKGDASQLVTMHYTDTSLKKSNELQIYYSSPRSYQDFLEAIRRRSDTFYVVSFRRDHLLLPATNRNKTTRPKMSIILPSMNVNENVINGQEYEVMMQIDCEVMDTRILHVKSASIPPFLREHRENQTKPFYNSASSSSEQTHILGTINESLL